jgi:hypothetical protein
VVPFSSAPVGNFHSALDMNARHVLIQEQLQRDRRASRIGFDVLAITRVPVGNRRRLSIPGNYSVPYQLKAT